MHTEIISVVPCSSNTKEHRYIDKNMNISTVGWTKSCMQMHSLPDYLPKGRRTLDPKRANDILPKSVEE